MGGKIVRLVQPRQVWLKVVPAEVSMGGKLVRLVLLNQVKVKVVPADVSMGGKMVISDQSRQNSAKSVTLP